MLELAFVHLQDLGVAERDDRTIIGERAVDQLRGQHHVADREPDL
jgi:hypothetical protein